jgi:hypothetical protein
LINICTIYLFGQNAIAYDDNFFDTLKKEYLTFIVDRVATLGGQKDKLNYEFSERYDILAEDSYGTSNDNGTFFFQKQSNVWMIFVILWTSDVYDIRGKFVNWTIDLTNILGIVPESKMTDEHSSYSWRYKERNIIMNEIETNVVELSCTENNDMLLLVYYTDFGKIP